MSSSSRREGIELDDEHLELLVERTEGWPAGLYLAALWLRELADPREGVRVFAGSHRQVADYLAGEVLESLPPDTKDFLMRTSVLGRFTPELCDAVLDRQDSAAVLAELKRSNVFIVALDGRGEWYRYHHLFGDLLRLELTETRLVATLGAAPSRGSVVSRTGVGRGCASSMLPPPMTTRSWPRCSPSTRSRCSKADE